MQKKDVKKKNLVGEAKIRQRDEQLSCNAQCMEAIAALWNLSHRTVAINFKKIHPPSFIG